MIETAICRTIQAMSDNAARSDRETIDAILRLHPDTREIFIINDYLKTGRAWTRTIHGHRMRSV